VGEATTDFSTRMGVLRHTIPGAMTRDTGLGRTNKNKGATKATRVAVVMETQWKTATMGTPHHITYQEGYPIWLDLRPQ